MSKAKSITQLVTELQTENERLGRLDKLFNTACKSEFGFNVKELHAIIQKLKMYERKASTSQAGRQGPRSPVFAQQNGDAGRGGQEPLPYQPQGDTAGGDKANTRQRAGEQS